MIRSVRIVVVLGVALALAVAATVPAIAASSAPRAALTHTEYTELTAEQVAFKKLEKKKNLTWNDFYKACHAVGQSTDLLKNVRSNCETGIGIDQSLAGFDADAQRCVALSTSTTTTPTSTTTTGTTTTGTGTTTTGTGTTTTGTGTTTTGTGTTTTGTGTTTTGTGTTTTGTGGLSATDFKELACLQPEYAVIGRAANAVYLGQANLRKAVLARHFVGRCLLTLAPSTSDVIVYKRFASTSKQLAADVEVVTKVADGSAPASDINNAQIAADSLAFATASKALGHVNRPQKLSVCPHG